MKTKYRVPFAAVTLATLAGCASSGGNTASVIPQANGMYQVSSSGENKEDALKSALSSAEATCNKRNMRHVVLDQKTKYKGVLTEGSSNLLNKLPSIGPMWMLSRLSDDKDYEVSLAFTCEA